MTMKKIISRLAIALVGMFLALSANAQTSDNPRKIWLVAHACNAHRWLQTALEDGANGVEIDVDCPKQISPTATYVDFSVAHDGYVTPEKRAEEKRKYRIIDFSLSNCANSGITKVGVLTQYESIN